MYIYIFGSEKEEKEVHEEVHEDKDKDTRFYKIAHEAKEIADNPPATWDKYKDMPSGLMDIAVMEFGEAQLAYAGMKVGTVKHSDFTKELLHTIAACMYAYEKMTCDD